MPFNVPGILVPFHLILNPRLVLPSLTVKDIRQLDFPALRRAGYRGAVFDKDNCLTLPHRDSIVPDLQHAWQVCRDAFGEGNVLIVSNSAGTRQDAGEIIAESVTHHTGVPVLRHRALKPSYSCIKSIRKYFSSLRVPIQDNELIVVGDRIFTDVVLANRMARKRSPPEGHPSSHGGSSEKYIHVKVRPGPLAIWTTGVWYRESMIMRWFETKLVDLVEKWPGRSPNDSSKRVEGFLKHQYMDRTIETKGTLTKLWSTLRRKN